MDLVTGNGPEMRALSKQNVNVHAFTPISWDDSLLDQVEATASLFTMIYIIMALFACTGMSFFMGTPGRCDCKSTRFTLGLQAISLIMLSIAAGYGLAVNKLPIIELCMGLPFVLVGIGLDDGFIIVSTFDMVHHLAQDSSTEHHTTTNYDLLLFTDVPLLCCPLICLRCLLPPYISR